MRAILFAATAALAVLAAPPASAQSLSGAGFSAGSAFAATGSGGTTRGIGNATHSSTGVTIHHSGGGDWSHNGHGRSRDRNSGFGGGYYSGDLRDGYDLNRGWASDSYNDWWHDRPDRAFPRWMSANQDCQRQWWSGGGWRC